MSKPSNLRRPNFLAALPGGAEAPVQFASVAASARRKPNLESPQPNGRGAKDPETEHSLAAAAAVAAAQSLERLELAIRLLRSQGERLAEQARSDALELAFLVAKRILEQEIHINPSGLMGLIRSAIQRAGEANRFTVRLSPADLEALQRAGSPTVSMGLSLAKVEMTADGTLASGDCIVETELGTVDGRLSTRLTEMREVVAAAMTQGGA